MPLVFDDEVMAPPSSGGGRLVFDDEQPAAPAAKVAEPPIQSIAATAAYSFPKTFSNVATGTVGGIAKMADVGLDVVNKYTGIGKPEIFKTIGEVMDDASGYAAEMYPVDERNPVTATVMGGAAQAVSLLAGGAAGKALGLGEAALTRIPLALGAAQGANQGIDTARELGVETPEAQLALGALFGGTEVLTEKLGGIGNKAATDAILDRFRKPAGEMLKDAAKAVVIEGVEEIAAGSVQDWLARAFATEDPANPGFTKTGVPLPEVDPRTKEFLKKRGMEFLGGAAGGGVFAGAQVLANAGKPEAPPPSIESGESVIPPNMGAPDISEEDALDELDASAVQAAGVAARAEDADAQNTANELRATTAAAMAVQPSTEQKPRSRQPSAILPARALESTTPRPQRAGRDTTAKDEWDEQFGDMRKGGRTHNDDGSPYQPTVRDETMGQVFTHLGSVGDTADARREAVGDSNEVTISASVARLLDAGWVWDAGKGRMTNPQNPNERAIDFLSGKQTPEEQSDIGTTTAFEGDLRTDLSINDPSAAQAVRVAAQTANADAPLTAQALVDATAVAAALQPQTPTPDEKDNGGRQDRQEKGLQVTPSEPSPEALIPGYPSELEDSREYTKRRVSEGLSREEAAVELESRRSEFTSSLEAQFAPGDKVQDESGDIWVKNKSGRWRSEGEATGLRNHALRSLDALPGAKVLTSNGKKPSTPSEPVVVLPAAPTAAPAQEPSPPVAGAAFTSRNAEMLPDTDTFGGKFDEPLNINPSSYVNKDGIETVEYTNPRTGEVDVYISAFGDKDFIAYMRQYDENGNPTNRWTSKLERRTKRAGATKAMLQELQSRLPAGHQYTEDSSVSTDGLRFIAGQLRQGYTVATNPDGSPQTSEVAISGESITNDLPVAVDPNGKFENIRITSPAEFAKVKKHLGKMLESFGVGLNEGNVRWENGTAFIDLPILQSTARPAAQTRDYEPGSEDPKEIPPQTPEEQPSTEERPESLTESEKVFASGLAKKYGMPVLPSVPAEEPYESISRFSNMLEAAADKSKDESELALILAASKGKPDSNRIATAVAYNPHSSDESFAEAKSIINPLEAEFAPDPDAYRQKTEERNKWFDARRKELRQKRNLPVTTEPRKNVLTDASTPVTGGGMNTIEAIEREAAAIGEMQAKQKERASIYNAGGKEDAADLIGIKADRLYNLPYEKWSEVDKAVQAFRKEAQDAWTGSDKTLFSEIWKLYAQANPDKVAKVRNSVESILSADGGMSTTTPQRDATKPEQMSPEEYVPEGGSYDEQLKAATEQASLLAAERAKPLPDVSVGGQKMIRSNRAENHKAAVRERDMLKSLGREGFIKDSQSFFIRNAVADNKPVSAAAVEAYGIKLPEGYVKQGELYVFQPQTPSQPPQAPAVQAAAQAGVDEARGEEVFSTASRGRPVDRVSFEKPIQTPAGEIVSYEWQYKLEEVPDKEGEMGLRRFSDWDQAEKNADTGRDIVHKFTIRKPDGSLQVVSLESALGQIPVTAAKGFKAAIKAARRLPVYEAELARLEKLQAESEAAFEYARKELWKQSPPIELRDSGFPQVMATGARMAWIGDREIALVDKQDISADGTKVNNAGKIYDIKRQWAEAKAGASSLSYSQQERIANLRRSLKRDKATLKESQITSWSGKAGPPAAEVRTPAVTTASPAPISKPAKPSATRSPSKVQGDGGAVTTDAPAPPVSSQTVVAASKSETPKTGKASTSVDAKQEEPSKPPDAQRTIAKGDKVKFKQEGVLQSGTYVGVNSDGTYSVQVKGEKNPRHVSARSLNENNDGSVVEGTAFSPIPDASPAETVVDKDIDSSLSDADKAAAATELGFKSWNARTRSAFKKAYADWLVTAKAATTKLAEIFSKLAKATRALIIGGSIAISTQTTESHVVINDLPVRSVATARAFPAKLTSPEMRMQAASLPSVAPIILPEAGSTPPRVQASVKTKLDMRGTVAPVSVTKTAKWVVDTQDTKGRPFIIGDKTGGSLYVFDGAGNLVSKESALFGADRGDKIKGASKVTPSGRFDAQIGDVAEGDYNYGSTLDFEETEDSTLAIHRVYLAEPRERRAERLASESPADNRVSWGCVNVPDALYDGVIEPLFSSAGGIVYILPETKAGAKSFSPLFALPASRNSMPLDKARAHVFNKLKYSPRKVRVINEPSLKFRGRYDPDGTITLNSAYLGSIEELDDVLLNHEAIHDAVETDDRVRKQADSLLSALSEDELADIEAEILDYKDGEFSEAEIQAERQVEAIRRLTANRPDLKSAWGRLVESVSLKLKKMFGGDVTRQQAELVAARIVARGLKRLRKGKTGGRIKGGTLYGVSPSDFFDDAVSDPRGNSDFNRTVFLPSDTKIPRAGEISPQDVKALNAAWTSPEAKEWFTFGKTESRDADDIASAFSTPDSPITATSDGNKVVFEASNGGRIVVEVNTSKGNAVLNILKNGPAAGQLYQAALTYLHNNDLEKNNLRLTERNAGIRLVSNMLSSALRHGTTKHLNGHGISGIIWRKGDDAWNIAQLARHEQLYVFGNLQPGEIKALLASAGLDGTGLVGTDAPAVEGARTGTLAEVLARPARYGIGPKTVARAAVTASVLQGKDGAVRQAADRIAAVKPLYQANPSDVTRFKQLTASIPKKPTAEQLETWKQEHPAELKELEAMRERVLREQGYTVRGFHGTLEDFNVFDMRLGRTSGSGVPSAFFTSDEATAGDYSQSAATAKESRARRKQEAGDIFLSRLASKTGTNRPPNERVGPNLYWINGLDITPEIREKAYEALDAFRADASDEEFRRDRESKSPRVIDAYLRLDNPRVVEANRLPGVYVIPSNIKEAKRGGHDGLIIKDVKDGPFADMNDSAADVTIVFSPSQIKSADPLATDDSGNLITPESWGDETSPDIRYSLAPNLRQRQNEPITGKEKRGQAFGQPEIAQIHQQQSTEVARQAAQAVFNSAETPITPESRNTFLDLLRTFLDPRLGPAAAQDLIEAGNDMAPVALQDEMATFALRAAAEGDTSLLNMFLNNVNRMSTGSSLDANVSKSGRDMVMRRWAQATTILHGLDGLNNEKDKLALKSGVTAAEMQALQDELNAAKVKIEELIAALEAKTAAGSGQNGIKIINTIGGVRKKAAKAKAKTDADEAKKALIEKQNKSLEATMNKWAGEMGDPWTAFKEKVANKAMELVNKYIKGEITRDALESGLVEIGVPEKLAVKTANVASVRVDVEAAQKTYDQMDKRAAQEAANQRTAEGIVKEITERLSDPEVSAPIKAKQKKALDMVRELAKTYRGGTEEALMRERLAELDITPEVQNQLVNALNFNLEANQAIRYADQPSATAQAIVDGYVKRFIPTATAPEENRTKTRIEQALRMSAPTVTKQEVFDTLTKNLQALGVAPALADSVAKITADAWQIRRSAAIEEAVEKVDAKWLLQRVLKADVNLQQSPGWRQGMMAQWLSLSGFTAREVALAVKVLDKPFNKALADVRIEAAERFAEQMRKVLGVEANVKARRKKNVIPAIQRVQNALRSGSFESVSAEMAKWKGWKPLSPAELKKLNELDSLIKAAPVPKYKGANPPHYVLKATHEMFNIFKQHVSGSALENMAIGFHLNLLSGLPTAGVNIVGPPMKIIAESIIDVARGGATLDLGRFQSMVTALKTAASTYFKEARFTAKYDISDRYGVTEITTTREIANLNYQLDKWLAGLKQAVKDKSPMGVLKGVFGVSDIVRRFLTVADTAGTAAVNAYSLIMGAHQMAKDAGISRTNIQSMFTESRRAAQRAYSDALMAGYSAADAGTAAVDASRAAILGGVYEFVSPEKAFMLDRMSRQEGFLAIGRKPVDDDLTKNFKGEEMTTQSGEDLEGGLVSRHLFFGVAGMNDMLELISRFKYGGNTPKGKAFSTVIGTLMYGLVHVPYRASRHFAAYSPYGFIRYGVKKLLDHQGKDNWFQQSMGTPEQEQQALWRAAAGSTVMLLIASLFKGSDEPEEKDKDYITVTGNGPPTDDPQVRDAWIKQGNQPYHMRGRLFGVPFNINIGRGGESLLFSALPFAVMDDLALRDKLRGYKSKEYEAADIADAFSTYVAAITAKGGMGGLIDLSGKNTSTLSSGKGIAGAVSNYASNIIPLNRLIQTTENLFISPPDKSTVETTITANIPLARLGNFPALNRMGDPVGDPAWLGKISYMGVPLPIDVEPTEKNKKVYEVIHAKMAAPGRMNRVDVEKKYGELTNRQWYDFVKTSGRYISSRIEASHDKLMRMDAGRVDKWMTDMDQNSRAQAAKGLGLKEVKRN